MPPSADTAAHLAYAAQLGLGMVFLFAAVPKLRHPAAFARTVAAYGFVSGAVSRALAPGLIAVEVFLAFAFLSGWLFSFALPLAALALIGFAVATTVNLRRGRRVACGCFGDPNERLSGRSLARLTVMLLSVLALAIASISGVPVVTAGSLAAGGERALPYVLEMTTVGVGFLVTAQWVLTLPELAVLFSRAEGRERGAVEEMLQITQVNA